MKRSIDGLQLAERLYGPRKNGAHKNGGGKNGNGHAMVNGASGGLKLHRKEAIPDIPPLAPRTNARELNRDVQLIQPETITADMIELHPLVENFPPASPDQLHQLAADIKRAGHTAPFIVTVDWRVTHQKKGCWFLSDDRNRFHAAEIAGVPLEFRPINSMEAEDHPDLVARLNLPAAHLTDSQRAAIAVPFTVALAADGKIRRLNGLRRGDSGIASKNAIPANPPVGPKMAPRGNGQAGKSSGGDRAAVLMADRFGVSAGYIKLATKIFREDPRLYHQLRLNRDDDGKEINLFRAKNLLHQKNSLRVLGALRGEKCEPIKPTDKMVIHGDCLVEMNKLPTKAIPKFPLIIIDPPYNNKTVYDSDPTCDNRKDRDYLTWCKYWFSECARLLTPEGSLFVIISAVYQGRFDSRLRATDPPLHWRNTIVWFERFGTHQTTKFTCETKFIHYFTRSEKPRGEKCPEGFVWNGDDILVPSARVEQYGDSRGKQEGKVPGNLWDVARMPGNDSKRAPWKSPPQIPPGVLERIIKVASNPGDTVFDPMCGNGTTGRMALRLGRNFLGIEWSKLYAEQARLWIAGAMMCDLCGKAPFVTRCTECGQWTCRECSRGDEGKNWTCIPCDDAEDANRFFANSESKGAKS